MDGNYGDIEFFIEHFSKLEGYEKWMGDRIRELATEHNGDYQKTITTFSREMQEKLGILKSEQVKSMEGNRNEKTNPPVPTSKNNDGVDR